jgi:glycosyltransferase involved in cell wall biosynthesis
MDTYTKKLDDLKIKNIIEAHPKPLVSVMICTYNRAKMLPKALDSVLMQDYSNLEIIVLDDASTDETEGVVRKYASADNIIQYHCNDNNLGINKSRNKALNLCSGRYVAVLDSDDYWIDNQKISAQVKLLEENPDHALIGTFTEIVDDEGNRIGEITPAELDSEIRDKILMQNQFVHSSVMYRKSVVRQYVDKYFIWEDLATWLEVGKDYSFSNLPIFTTALRKHSSNISSDKKFRGIKTLGKIIYDNRKFYPNFIFAMLKNYLRMILALIGR